jgi:hypothetical protein
LLKFVKSLKDVSLHLFSSLGHTMEMYKPANARHSICAIVSDNHASRVADHSHRKSIQRTGSIAAVELQASIWLIDYSKATIVDTARVLADEGESTVVLIDDESTDLCDLIREVMHDTGFRVEDIAFDKCLDVKAFRHPVSEVFFEK